MKPLKDLQEISRMLAANPDFPAPNGVASIVQPEVFLNRIDQLSQAGLGLPLAQFTDSEGIYMKLFFTSIAESATVFVPTQSPAEFLAELRRRIVITL